MMSFYFAFLFFPLFGMPINAVRFIRQSEKLNLIQFFTLMNLTRSCPVKFTLMSTINCSVQVDLKIF